MGKAILYIAITIFVTGLIAGIFFGASIKTGESINPESQIVKVLGIFCDSIKNLSTEAYSTCKLNFLILSVFVVIIGIIEIMTTASQIRPFSVGITIYVIGFIVGLIMILGE